MAAAAAGRYGAVARGLVLVPDGHLRDESPPPGFGVLFGGHPVPDERSVHAADAALALAASLEPDDLLLVLLSGGGSAVMCKPRGGLSLAQKQELNRQLHNSGASIGEINRVRRQLSAIKGGRLSAACAAPVVTLAISDVPGNDPGTIASGPTVPDRGTAGEALDVLERYRIDIPQEVRDLLNDSDREGHALRSGYRDNFTVVATGSTMLEAAGRELEAEGYRVIDLGDAVEGDAREIARAYAQLAREQCGKGRTCILSGGESAVTIRSEPGLGGRNTEYLLALAIELDGLPGAWAIAGDSDGIDGKGGHAGAVIGPDTLRRAGQAGLDAQAFLEAHDSATFFRELGDLVVTGPTQTNVNDFRAVLIS